MHHGSPLPRHMLQRSSEEKESERASMAAWRSGDGGGVSPPAASRRRRSKTALLAFTLPQTLQSQDVIIHADMICLKMV